MLAQARSKEIYDRLEKADIAALAPAPEAYDLIVAADVFAYVGALEQVIGWCAAALRPGGWLAFSVEAANEEDGPITLRESRRFAHSRSYLADLLSDAGFTGTAVTPATLRMEHTHGSCRNWAQHSDDAGRKAVSESCTDRRRRRGHWRQAAA